MRTFFLVAAAVLTLASPACTSVPASIPTAPSEITAKTVVDEKIAIGAEEAYKTFRIAAELGVQAGVIKGATATKVRELDTQLYAALGLIRSAYDTGQADDFSSAVAAFNSTLRAANSVLGSTNQHGEH